ncbi:MAG: tetratricopeptide repeat protein [Bacteroidetes bacterium]|nr:tetratricopeptide repeat protein [Bacteroidota bacterium]
MKNHIFVYVQLTNRNKMIIKTTITLICLFISAEIFGQTPEIDSLQKRVENTNGKEKIIALTELCMKFYSVNPRKGIDYGQQALQLAESLKISSLRSKIYNNLGANYLAMSDFINARSYFKKALTDALLFKDSFEIATYYSRMGIFHELQGKFDSALWAFNEGLPIFRKLKNYDRTGVLLENIGTIHLNRGEFKSALTFLIDAKTVFEKTSNKKELPYIYLKLGQIYSESKDYPAAEKWFQKGIEGSLSNHDLIRVGTGLNALGIIRRYQGKYEEALNKFEEALKTIRDVNNRNLTLSIYANMANIYTDMGYWKEALKYQHKAIEIAQLIKNPLAIARLQFDLGDIYMGMKDYPNARTCFEKALPAFLASKDQSDMLKTYNELIKVNNLLRNFEQSVKYYQLFQQVRDTLSKKELNTTLDSLRVKFNTEQTENENIALVQKTELQNNTIILQRTILISTFILILLVTSLVIVIFRSRNKIQVTNALLEIKNNEISEKAEELRTTNEKLVELSNFKDSMNSFLVHDLKNPLNTIINIDPRDHSEHQVESVRHSGMKMLSIVMNLLDTHRYEHNTMKIKTEASSITKIVTSAFNDLRYPAEQKQIRLKIEYPNDHLVNLDPVIIERVFNNLFSNAIKFSPRGGIITVLAEITDQSRIKILVNDHGEGIEEKYLDKVFDKFFQVRETQSGSTRSTGIGLTFCKLAVESHGGKIGVDSVVGQGTSFWFTLPLADIPKGKSLQPVSIEENSIDSLKLELSEEEKLLLIQHCQLLHELSIYQLSDVKDCIHRIEFPESSTISEWKSLLLSAVSECNEEQFHYLINLPSSGKFYNIDC